MSRTSILYHYSSLIPVPPPPPIPKDCIHFSLLASDVPDCVDDASHCMHLSPFLRLLYLLEYFFIYRFDLPLQLYSLRFIFLLRFVLSCNPLNSLFLDRKGCRGVHPADRDLRCSVFLHTIVSHLSFVFDLFLRFSIYITNIRY